MERSRTEQHRLKRRRRQKQNRAVLGLSAIAMLCAAGAVIWFGSGSATDSPGKRPADGYAAASPSAPASSKAPGKGTAAPSASPRAASPSPSGIGTASPNGPAGALPKPYSEGGPRVKMAFVGDVIFASTVETLLKKNGYDYPYPDLLDELAKPDITAANLETPVTLKGSEQKKEYTYRSHPDALAAFKAAGFDVVNLANNHIMDYGTEGLLDTLSYLDKAGILRTGAGVDDQEAYKPAIIEKNGIKVAFLGFSHKVPDPSWKAGRNKPGTTQLYDPKQAMDAIALAKKNADLVVVMAHWGIERDDKPQDIHRKMAKSFIDAGADLIIGTHPHVLQSLEAYKGKWIAYSLGNFLFTTNDFAPSWETVVFQADCSKSGACSISLVPVLNKFARPVKMDPAASKALFDRLTSISYGVRVDETGNVKAE